MILMNDFKREYKFFKKEIDTAISKVLNSGWYILGKEVEEFEKEFAKYIGSKYCIGVANGLEALQISLMALGIGEGDEVITVSNTAVATALAITNTGAKPVFVDVDEYYLMDVSKIEEKITPKTKAILPVHLFGQMVNMTQLKRIAKKYKLKIVEDICQAHGAKQKKKKAGRLGELGCFSFYPTKNLGAYGDGGAIVTNSKDLYEKIKMLRNYGQKNRYEHKHKGLNSRLDEIQAAILRVKLKMLDHLNGKRRKIAQMYFNELKNIPGIDLPKARKESKSVYQLFVIKTNKRDKLQKYLSDNGIQTLIHYPIPIHKQECYPEYNDLVLEKTEKAANEILSIPISPFLSVEEVKFICKTVKDFYNSKLPSVTVAVSAYNEQYNIGPFLESVIAQKPKGFKFDEIFVISDGSTDSTAEKIYKVLNKYRKNKQDKNLDLPKIIFKNDPKRIGKSTRLNQMFEHLKSDYLVLADADVIFADEFVIKNLIEKFKINPNIGLVGGNPLPLPPKTFIEKCIDVTFQAYLPIRNNYKGGNSILSATGRIMALRNKVAKKITVPQNTISNDGFIYFANLTLGYDYICAQDATVYFRSPQNLEDQLSQNTRFQATHAFMKKYFPTEVVDREYFIPPFLLISNMVKQTMKHPILSVSIFIINRYCQLKASVTLSKINALWEVVYTSKKLVTK